MGKILNLLAAQGTHLGQEHQRQILALDSKLDEMESEITTLKAENLRLKAQVNPLQREVDRLKDRINEFQNKNSKQENPLDKNEEVLLKWISLGKQPTPGMIDKNTALTTYYLGRLAKRVFIQATFSYTEQSEWYCTQDGLEYLAKNDLLKD